MSGVYSKIAKINRYTFFFSLTLLCLQVTQMFNEKYLEFSENFLLFYLCFSFNDF